MVEVGSPCFDPVCRDLVMVEVTRLDKVSDLGARFGDGTFPWIIDGDGTSRVVCGLG